MMNKSSALEMTDYPEGIGPGDEVELVQQVDTDRGVSFHPGVRMIVGMAYMNAAKRPSVSLWLRSLFSKDDSEGVIAEGGVSGADGVERDAYKLIQKARSTRTGA